MQTSYDFEWLVVDDGSSDDTEKLFVEWQQDKLFPVRYVRQSNGGKHRAINRGAELARGELFFIVDSDDYLAKESIETIVKEWHKVKDKEYIAGVCGLRAYPSGQKVGGEEDWSNLDCNSLDFRYKYNCKGDMAEVLRTDVLREYPFPEIQNEKFCPELLVFSRIASKYKLHYFYRKIYICDYLPDGLTAKITKIRMLSPVASCMCYKELVDAKVPWVIKLKNAINYWRFRFCNSPHAFPSLSSLWLWTLPVGYLMHLRDKKQLKNT